ncbi:MAG: cobalamin-binding protein [Candidatus Roseilinea sp.]|nr:MAG: cobalamin-binding protein [Candidatus Roseilinea sp.]
MRIVSLLPSATEIVCLLGLRDSLVGRSHECDYPPEVADVPVMTYSSIGVTGDDGAINPELTSAEIDARVSQHLRDGLSLYGLHPDRLDAAKPDLILTQELCDVCAVSYATVRAVVRDLGHKWEGSAQVVSLEPTDIEGIFQTILTVGELTGTNAVAKARVRALRDRLDRVREALAGIAHRPTVAALEWLDPPFAPGHWVPEQIEIAGGNPVLGRKGKPSFRCTWEDVARTQAECVIAMPCGFDLAGSVREFQKAATHEAWRDLPATYLWQLYAVDATSYFSRPGPRVVDGVEILAGLLHPNRWPTPGPDRALRVNDFILSWHPTR